MDRMPPSILAAFVEHARADPGRECARRDDQLLTYGALLRLAQDWAARYAAPGLQRGDRVGLFLPGGAAFLGAYLGAQLQGGAVVLINTQYRQQELRHILSDSEPRVVVTDANGAALLRQALGEAAGAPALLLVPEGGLLPAGPAPEEAQRATRPPLPAPEDLAVLA
ncbi:MAG: AMP-binding protein, partial [Chloroflexaceae bacterium]